MIEKQPTLLVATPRPKIGESFMGFLLRSSEMNGYPNLNMMLRYAGLTNQEMNRVVMPISKIARIFGVSQQDFSPINYVVMREEQPKYFRINGHDLHTYYLSMKKVKICPECIEEQGFSKGVWLLRHAIICPKHERILVDNCSVCNSKLNWNRKGLLYCRCGADLRLLKPKKIINPCLIALAECIEARFNGEDNYEKAVSVGFPVEHIRAISLQLFLGLIVSFGRDLTGQKPSINIVWDVIHLSHISKVWEQWPLGIYKLLDKSPPLKHFGVSRQYEQVYRRLVKRQKGVEGVKFIKEALVSYCTEHRKNSLSYRPLAGSELQPTSVGITELSRKTGVHPKTLYKMYVDGVLPAKVLSNGRNKRLLFELKEGLVEQLQNSESLSIKQAAKRMGVPAPILKVMRESGVFSSSSTNSFRSFLLKDIYDFLGESLRNIHSKVQHFDVNNEIKLSVILNKKSISIELKVALIQAILKNKIDGVYKDGSTFQDIWLPLKFLISLKLCRVEIEGFFTATEAAAFLSCDKSVVIGLINSNLIPADASGNGFKIPFDIFIKFAEEYVTLNNLAKYHHCSLAEVKSEVRRLNLNTFDVRHSKRNLLCSFVSLKEKAFQYLYLRYKSDLKEKFEESKRVHGLLMPFLEKHS